MSDQEIIGPDDEYDDPFADEPFDEPRPGMSGRAKLVAAGASLIGLVALAFVGWFAFQQGIRSGAEEAAPVVRAAPEPIKRKPVNPGGLDVPHQDKLVFNRLAPGQVNEPVERLLPPPEEPAERPVAPQVPVEVPAEIPAVVDVIPERPEPQTPSNVVVETPPPPPPAPPVSEQAPPPAPPKPLIAKAPPPPPTPPVVETKSVAPPSPKPAATPAGGGWKIQLASVSSNAAAEREWKRMQSGNNELLGKLSLTIQTIKLDRGTFYRIQAGPLADRAAASSLCGTLKTRKQDCLIVAP
jgi:cell division septation protein DedD